jgi:hypothetical protein
MVEDLPAFAGGVSGKKITLSSIMGNLTGRFIKAS